MLRVLYACVMMIALAWWTLVAVAAYFPNARLYLHLDL